MFYYKLDLFGQWYPETYVAAVRKRKPYLMGTIAVILHTPLTSYDS